MGKTRIAVGLMHRVTPPGELRLKGDYATIVVNGDNIGATTNIAEFTHPFERTPWLVGCLDGLTELVNEAGFRLVIHRGHSHLRFQPGAILSFP
jgi:hypothetical protein